VVSFAEEIEALLRKPSRPTPYGMWSTSS
jgi:hypothetical protein